jgi:1-acyl-sn-glycerol-3-phosphate acyltransferase
MAEGPRISAFVARLKPVVDPLATAAAWTYFIGAFLFPFSLFYLFAILGNRNPKPKPPVLHKNHKNHENHSSKPPVHPHENQKNRSPKPPVHHENHKNHENHSSKTPVHHKNHSRETAVQRLNHRFFRGFFGLVRRVSPGLRIRVSDEVRRIRGAVVVANHRSYLDPILLVSLFPRQKTIVKSGFFRVPVFGWLLKMSGFLPSATENDPELLMVRQMETMGDFLADGGVLFVFPEGTRSRDGNLGPFNKGAFKIARNCGAPIRVLRIQNTERLFSPGRFRFHTCIPNTISVEAVGTLEGADLEKGRPLSEIMDRVRGMLEAAPDHETQP